MKITGAIFDCDGTLLDSMPMWKKVMLKWLSSHNVTNPKEFIDKYEYMNFEDECYFFHRELNICKTPEEAFNEAASLVAHAYAEEVLPFDGVKEFLETLKKKGIKMVVASSTNAHLVKQALAAHGLLEYFDHIFYTGDVGKDKSHPDIYYAAHKFLKTKKENTWVFEDAPFGVKTAYDAGFPVVCVYNEHDGRDISFLRNNSDILIHSYQELTLELLYDYEKPLPDKRENPDNSTTCTDVLNALIVGGSPHQSSADLIAELADKSDYIIAADRGADALYKAKITPDVLCGDLDSISVDAKRWAQSHARRQIIYPADKYATDLALAIECAEHEAIRQNKRLQLTLTCFSGGRIDHMLSVVAQVIKHERFSPRLIENAEGIKTEARILSSSGSSLWKFSAKDQGKTFSALTFDAECCISEKGMKWELDHAELAQYSDMGISNIVASSTASIICHKGTLICMLTDIA